SAAERQDYEELLSPRQAFLQLFLLYLTPPQPRKRPAPQERCAFYRLNTSRQHKTETLSNTQQRHL
ncbi:MAG: hypothetical protein Q8N89_09140, partial [Azonexus sp.]|nr:hypothetical protein [Azonexus sp.]